MLTMFLTMFLVMSSRTTSTCHASADRNSERPPERGQKLKEGPEKLGHGRELRSPQVGLGWRWTTAREQEVLGPRAGDEGLGSSPSYPSPGGLQDPAELPLNDLS